jgi:redox-sensing transcriptional repressor
VVIIGAGRLGIALASYLARGTPGLRVSAIYDADPTKIGTTAAGLEIRGSEHLVHDELTGVLAVITTPESFAQQIADQLVAAGIRSILNFAPIGLEVPSDVTVRSVDLAGELYVLSFFQDRQQLVFDRGGHDRLE